MKSEVARLGHELIVTFSDANFMNGREGLIVFYALTTDTNGPRQVRLRASTGALALVFVQQLTALSIFSTSFGRGEMLQYLTRKLNQDLFNVSWHFQRSHTLRQKRDCDGGLGVQPSELEFYEGYTLEEENDFPHLPSPVCSDTYVGQCPFMLQIRLRKREDFIDPYPKSKWFPRFIIRDLRKKIKLIQNWNHQKLFCKIDKYDITIYLQIVKIISISVAAWAFVYKIFFIVEI